MATKLRAPGGPVTLRAVHPNAGIEAYYRKQLTQLVDEMQASIVYWVSAQWRKDTPETTLAMDAAYLGRVRWDGRNWGFGCVVPSGIAMDASATALLRGVLQKLTTQWMRNMTDGADRLSKLFADKTLKTTDVAMKKTLKDAGFTVEFKMTPVMQDAYSGIIGEQVGLIKSIGANHLAQVETIVMQGVQTGRDLGAIASKLQSQLGVTKRRAALIARDQSNKATSTITRTRQLDLGITHSKWRHSGGGKEPRPDHVAASGKTFDLRKGMFLDGTWTWPGVEINCRCTSEPVIPGFDDDDD